MSTTPHAASTRRELLRHAAMSAAGLALLPPTVSGAMGRPGFHRALDPMAPQANSPYAPFRVGIQSYSLRHFNLDDALAKTQQLGLTYWEAFPGHIPITDDPKVIADYKAKLRAHNVTLVDYGALDFNHDEADARRKFTFAKAMGVETISAVPQPDSFPILNRLVEEYKINIAIHNHGPEDPLYGTFEKVLAAMKGQNRRIGACDDTGHYLRVNESPLSAARLFGDRLYDIHLKAVKDGPNNTKEFTEIGSLGNLLDTVGLFRLLVDRHYRGLIAIEYEIHEDDPMPYLQQCLEATRRFIRTLTGPGINIPAGG